jgi:hypothetical protein
LELDPAYQQENLEVEPASRTKWNRILPAGKLGTESCQGEQLEMYLSREKQKIKYQH